MTIIIALVFLLAYLTPGLYLARGMYGQAIREVNSKAKRVIPAPPPRPKIRVNELLHSGRPNRCNLVKTRAEGRTSDVCTCGTRDEWIRLRNEWLDYNEWKNKYGAIHGAIHNQPVVDMRRIYASVPAWPLVAGIMFIKGGAKNIPDYREIERMENELRELN